MTNDSIKLDLSRLWAEVERGLSEPKRDIVERLRDCGLGFGDFKTERGDFGLCDDAADEIERLRNMMRAIIEDGK